LWSGLVEESPWPAAAVQALYERCRDAGMTLLLAPLAALLAWRTGSSTSLPAADGRDAMTPWTALFATRASLGCGRPAEAGRHAQSGSTWLEVARRERVPAPFRDAFIQRHAAHRELLALARRLVAE
jgi:hypothetical protein